MKNLTFLFAILSFSFVFSQCMITGVEQVQVGERQIYSVADQNVECNDCYQWIYLDQKIILEGNTHSNTLTVKGSVPGKSLLSLEIQTVQGILKCQKSVQVIAPTSNVLDLNAEKCNIPIDGFKESRISDTIVVFEPMISDNKFTYKWTVTYRNGSIKTSNEKLGNFEFSNENVIDHVGLSVSDKGCTKTIEKSYNPNFWYFF